LDDTARRVERLEEMIGRCSSAVVAFSGGVDSTFLLAVARDVLGDEVTALTVSSAFMPRHEREEASEIAGLAGARHVVLEIDMAEIDGFEENPADRCYRCKRRLFSVMKEYAAKNGIECVMDASNADDTADYRPGMKALRELEVMSPMLEAGLSKDEIRGLSRERGLPSWDKPSMACLASRIPYGERITPEKLAQVDDGERFLRSLGFGVCRVRHHGDIARVEVNGDGFDMICRPDVRRRIAEKLREIGFGYVTVDLLGYRMGSLNEDLPGKNEGLTRDDR